jgi:hypothetical protein
MQVDIFHRSSHHSVQRLPNPTSFHYPFRLATTPGGFLAVAILIRSRDDYVRSLSIVDLTINVLNRIDTLLHWVPLLELLPFFLSKLFRS